MKNYLIESWAGKVKTSVDQIIYEGLEDWNKTKKDVKEGLFDGKPYDFPKVQVGSDKAKKIEGAIKNIDPSDLAMVLNVILGFLNDEQRSQVIETLSNKVFENSGVWDLVDVIKGDQEKDIEETTETIEENDADLRERFLRYVAALCKHGRQPDENLKKSLEGLEQAITDEVKTSKAWLVAIYLYQLSLCSGSTTKLSSVIRAISRDPDGKENWDAYELNMTSLNKNLIQSKLAYQKATGFGESEEDQIKTPVSNTLESIVSQMKEQYGGSDLIEDIELTKIDEDRSLDPVEAIKITFKDGSSEDEIEKFEQEIDKKYNLEFAQYPEPSNHLIKLYIK